MLATSLILRQSKDGVRIVAAQRAAELKHRGFTPDETLDVMAADDFEVRVVEAAISEVYAEEKVEEAPTIVREAMIVPVKYHEIGSLVENALSKYGPREFVNLLTRSHYPIMPVNDRVAQSFIRLASQALKDENALSRLHQDLQPHFEEAMYQSVLAAQNPRRRLAVAAQKSDGKFVIASDRGDSCDVNLNTGTCSCKRYAEGNMALFGLACEHIVLAADAVSPHERLKRDVKSV